MATLVTQYLPKIGENHKGRAVRCRPIYHKGSLYQMG